MYLSGASPVASGEPSPSQLLLAPAERADLIVDFRNVPAGSRLILLSDAAAPYPDGRRAQRLLPGQPGDANLNAGDSDPTPARSFRSGSRPESGRRTRRSRLPKAFTPTDPFLLKQTPGVPTPNPTHVPVRRLTLNETFDEHGRLIQFLGTDKAVNAGPEFGRAYVDMPTEIIQAGSTEVWEIVNLTGDTHPIHFHLVNVEVLSRQPFDPDTYKGGAPDFTGPAVAPDRQRAGLEGDGAHESRSR